MSALPPDALAGILRELEQRADDCDMLAMRVEARGSADGNRHVAGDAAGYRAEADKLRGWARLLAAAVREPALARELSALDWADTFRELELQAEHYEAYASYCADRAGERGPEAATWRARAQRVRQLMTFFVEG